MLKIGHRGASAYAPENTLTAFRKALTLGADGMELDVHLCKSGEPVVIHDETVDRTTSGKGLVAELTLSQLRSLGIGRDEHIPTLEQVLQLGKSLYYFIELKEAAAALPVAELVTKYIKQGWDSKRLTVISFNHEALYLIAKNFPALSIGASFEQLPEDFVARAKALNARAVIPHYQALTPEHIKQAHAAHVQVITWTVNEPEDIARLKAMRVDGLISDYPDRL